MSAETTEDFIPAIPVEEQIGQLSIVNAQLETAVNGERALLSASRAALVAEGFFKALYTKEELVEAVSIHMSAAAENWLEVVDSTPAIEPPHGARETTIDIVPVQPDAELPVWVPAETFVYSSHDPYQDLNPGLTSATKDFIGSVMDMAALLQPTHDASLTYLSLGRSVHAKRATILTRAIMDTDAGIEDWIKHLPDAERLRIVANPWSDVPTLVHEDGQIKPIISTAALRDLVGSSEGGRAVREREGWERRVVSDFIANRGELPGNKLVITSLGTGTGEPAMDTALSAMKQALGEDTDFQIQVNGFDVNSNSLAVASHIAKNKDSRIKFEGDTANLLSHEGIKQAVDGTQADIYEAIGFAEYVPSENAPTEEERTMRAMMKNRGYLSAQEFYSSIYKDMPEGSILVTGNMRDDSSESSFIADGLGWQSIIQRSTTDYMRILEESGIPGEAVQLYTPDPENSAADYNLVVITKLPQSN